MKTFNKQQQRVPGSENIKENRKISKPKESTNDQIMKHESLKFHSIVTPPYFFVVVLFTIGPQNLRYGETRASQNGPCGTASIAVID